MGYSGGKSTPTYKDTQWHSEAIEVDYDPNIISYDELLEVFLETHDITMRPFAQRVKSIIFVRSDDEEKIARSRIEDLQEEYNTGIFTEIRKMETFYVAEFEHQLRYLKEETSLYEEMTLRYPSEMSQLNSVLLSKLNAAVLGFVEEEELEEIIDTFEISLNGSERLREINGFK